MKIMTTLFDSNKDVQFVKICVEFKINHNDKVSIIGLKLSKLQYFVNDFYSLPIQI